MSEQQQLIPSSPGDCLRGRRVKKKLTTSDIASQLRIDEPVVIAIEADQLDHLAPVYRRGYVKAYARHLGFKQHEIEQMLTAVDDQEPQLHTVFPEAARTDASDRLIKAVSYMLATLLVGTLVWQFSHEAIRLSGEANNSAEAVQGAAVPGTADSGQNSVRHVNASIAALENIKRPATQGAAASQAWAALQDSQRGPTENTPDGGADTGPTESVLRLSASGDSWVEITDATGQQLELDLVRGGTDKEYSGVAPFTIQLGRSSAISLSLDGDDVDLGPFTRGDVTRMVLDLPADSSG